MYEKRRKGRKRRKRKKEISRATSIITNTHAHPPYLLTHPLYIYIIYIILNLVLFCALYIAVCQLRSQLQVFFKPPPYFSILSYPYLRLPQIPSLIPLHFPSPRLRNLSRHTRHTLTYKSATHETRHRRYGRPIARRRFSRWINSFSSRWFFFAPFFPTTFAVPLTNDYCLSEIRTATISHRVSITFDGGAENVAIPASVFILFYSFASTIVGCARVFVSFLKARRFLLPVTEERENIAR